MTTKRVNVSADIAIPSRQKWLPESSWAQTDVIRQKSCKEGQE